MALLLSHPGPAPNLLLDKTYRGGQCGSVNIFNFTPTSVVDDISFIIFAAFREVLRFSKRASMLRLRAPISGAGVGAVLTRWTSLPPQLLRDTGIQASRAHKIHKSKWSARIRIPKKSLIISMAPRPRL